MKKKLWTLALAFCLVSAMLPGGVFHAERAWAADATSVKIGGVELNSDKPYYVNGSAVSDEPQNWTAKFADGTLTLNGLNLKVSGDTKGISANGDLAIKLEGSSKIETNNLAIYATSGNLKISGTGSLVAKNENTGRLNSLIYAQGNIVINNGAQVIATTSSQAQAINANAGNMEISGEGTTVKAVNENTLSKDSDAIRAKAEYNNGSYVGKGTVTVTNGAVLEAETKSKNAKAINGTVNAIDYAGKIKAGDSKKTATPLTGTTISADNPYKYVRIGEAAPNYLTFTAQEDDSSVTLNYASGADVKISTNGGKSWNSYTKGTEITLTNAGDKVSFKGTNVTTWADSNNTPKHFTMTGKIAASGSVTSLTDGVGSDPNVTLQEACYAYMFEGCTALTEAPELPAMEIPKSAYKEMFRGCTALTTAPTLPATNLKDWCYNYMFYNCTSLTTAPTLPAEALANNCYYAMFGECTSLTAAPKLPATKIPESAYALMFYKCTSLTAAPELSATEIGALGYYEMFAGCTSLTAAPKLPATEIGASSYYEMFYGCKGLTTVPELPATTLAANCYNGMFKDCTNLSISTTNDAQHTKEWIINATGSTPANGWNTNMFADCRNVDFGSGSKAPKLNTTYYVNPNGANSGGTTPTGKKIKTPTLEQSTFIYQGKTITPTLQFTNLNDKEYVTIDGHTRKKDVGNYTIKVTPQAGYTWEDGKADAVSLQWSITRVGWIDITTEKMTAYVDDITLPQPTYTIEGLLGEDRGKAKLTFVYQRFKENGTVESNASTPDLKKEGKYRVLVSDVTIGDVSYGKNYKGYRCNPGELEIVKKASTPSGGGYVAPSTDVKTSGSADSKVTSSPSTVQNETRTDASGKQETVAKVTVSTANQREILSQAKANKSKRIIIQIAKTAVQGDAKLELNLDRTFVQSILHDTEAGLTIRTADGDRVIAREALKTLVAQTEGNTVVIDPAAQENPTDPAEPSKAETLAAFDSSRLVARSKLVTLKNGKKGIRITWSDKNGAEMNFDGVEIYRSTKKNHFGKKPFYATRGSKSAGYYINSKSLKSGVTYYYKVRGYVLIDGQKHYTDLSLKAIRTVK